MVSTTPQTFKVYFYKFHKYYFEGLLNTSIGMSMPKIHTEFDGKERRSGTHSQAR